MLASAAVSSYIVIRVCGYPSGCSAGQGDLAVPSLGTPLRPAILRHVPIPSWGVAPGSLELLAATAGQSPPPTRPTRLLPMQAKCSPVIPHTGTYPHRLRSSEQATRGAAPGANRGPLAQEGPSCRCTSTNTLPESRDLLRERASLRTEVPASVRHCGTPTTTKTGGRGVPWRRGAPIDL